MEDGRVHPVDKKPAAHCNKCKADITKHCMSTVIPLMRVVNGQVVELATPVILTPLVCPECGAAMVSMQMPSPIVQARPRVITPVS